MPNATLVEKKLPARRDVPVGDTWDLSSLFASDAQWEAALLAWEGRIPGYAAFAGTLNASAERLAECLAYDLAVDREGDRLGTYAHLRASEDQAAAEPQRMVGRFQHVATQAGEKSSFMRRTSKPLAFFFHDPAAGAVLPRSAPAPGFAFSRLLSREL